MKFVVKKIGTLIITLLIISLVTFLAFQIIPGDSVLASLGTDATKEQIEAARIEMGYNKSIPERYLLWLNNAVHGNFGESTNYDMSVKKLVSERFSVTIGLGLISIFLIIIISIPFGIYTAKRKGSIIDQVILFLNQIGMAIPSFFLGMIITLLFGILLKWFTPGQYISIDESLPGYLGYLIYPAIAIAIPKIAMMVKFLRSSILRQLELDYVKTARSKGNTENQVLYGHVLKNALIPVITFLGMVIADVLAGSIIIEQVFNLPGLGRLLVVSISNRDFAVVQAIVLYIAVIVVVINFLVDVLYQYIDPRVNVAD